MPEYCHYTPLATAFKRFSCNLNPKKSKFECYWNTLPHLAELAEANHMFKKFVLRHVDATMDSGDLYKIREREPPIGPEEHLRAAEGGQTTSGWRDIDLSLKNSMNAIALVSSASIDSSWSGRLSIFSPEGGQVGGGIIGVLVVSTDGL